MPPASSLAAGQRQLGSAPAASRPRLPACGRVAAQAQEGNPHYRRSGGENNPRSNPNYRRGSQNDYWRKRENDRKSSRGASVSADNATRWVRRE